MSAAPEEKVVETKNQRAPSTIVAKFIENIDQHVAECGGIENAMMKLRDTYERLKSLEATLKNRKFTLMAKLPDIESSLEALSFLEKKLKLKKLCTRHLNFAKTFTLKPQLNFLKKTVHLWLGANVMLEYPYAEARTLLENNLSSAKESISTLEKDLDTVSDCVVTTEVNIARLYNWDVKQRKEKKAEAKN